MVVEIRVKCVDAASADAHSSWYLNMQQVSVLKIEVCSLTNISDYLSGLISCQGYEAVDCCHQAQGVIPLTVDTRLELSITTKCHCSSYIRLTPGIGSYLSVSHVYLCWNIIPILHSQLYLHSMDLVSPCFTMRAQWTRYKENSGITSFTLQIQLILTSHIQDSNFISDQLLKL